jgi:uncharacterized protein (TIGR02265 family)
LSNVTVDLKRVSEVLDLERRLRDIPDGACVRGVFVRLLEDSLARRGLGAAMDLRAIVGERPRSYRLYPARDLLIAYATAAALVHRDPREGLRLIFAEIADPFSNSWYGKTFLHFLRINPLQGLRWLERSRDHLVNYGHCRVQDAGPGRAVYHMTEEYFWIEYAQRGGCEGMLKACGVEGEVNVELDSRYRGRLDVRWQLRN